MKKFILACGFIVMLATGCGIPHETRQRAGQLEEQIKTELPNVDKAKEIYETLLEEEPWLKPIAVREQWSNQFTVAREGIEQARTQYDETVKPLLKKNDRNATESLSVEIAIVQRTLNVATSAATQPILRGRAIVAARQQAQDIGSTYGQYYDAIVGRNNEISALASRAQENHPQRIEDIASRVAPMQKAATDAQTQRNTLEAQLQKHDNGGDADYAQLLDAFNKLKTLNAQGQAKELGVATALKSLDESYTRVLVDMKLRYFVAISWSDWDENSDSREQTGRGGLVEVSEAVFLEVLEIGDDRIAKCSGYGACSMSAQADARVLEELGISPKSAVFHKSSGSNQIEYYIADWNIRYYHRYDEERNGNITTTDWEEVDEDFYVENLPNLHMTLESKPFGVFAEDRFEEPTPAGMAYVDDGNYGEWEENSSGSYYWRFYPRYNYWYRYYGGDFYGYGRTEYADYSSHRTSGKAYYGGKDSAGNYAYGSQSRNVLTSNAFAESHLGKSGGIQRVTNSLRKAGIAAREDGPQSGK